MTEQPREFTTYKLDDRYDQTEGRVFLTGTQALVRIMLDQARRRAAEGRPRTRCDLRRLRARPARGAQW